MVPPKEVVEILKKAGIKRAMVSSSNNEGTKMLQDVAPGTIVPELRPYRSRGEISTWAKDPTLIPFLEDLLSKRKYVAIGEFHIYGADADLPNVRRVVELAKQYGLFLHSHSDADAVDAALPAGPDRQGPVGAFGLRAARRRCARCCARYPTLWCDLAFLTSHASNGKVAPGWREAFLEFPDRFVLGSDTFTPERWHYVIENARWSRQWLADLPPDVARKIAYENGDRLFGRRAMKRWPPREALLAQASCASAATPAWADCPLDLGRGTGWVIFSDHYMMAFRPDPVRIEVGEPFALVLNVCTKNGEPAELVAVEAPDARAQARHELPADHRRSGDGRYRVEGLVFHMPGRWELSFDVRAGEESERLTPRHHPQVTGLT